MIYGAVYGDIIGSYYENHCTKDCDFEFKNESCFTDDTVMTAAVCKAITTDSRDITRFEIGRRAREYAAMFRQFYSYYPNAGYGQMFSDWAESGRLYKQRSYGNGAAMRAVPIGFAYGTAEQVILQAKASCLYTHNSREAFWGAEAVASAVFLANQGSSKDKIRSFIETRFGYDLSKSPNDMREGYVFNSRTNYSVPPAISAFLYSDDYESAVRSAVSLGGDADTMACIAGGIAEAFYKNIPKKIHDFCNIRLDGTIKKVINDFIAYCENI